MFISVNIVEHDPEAEIANEKKDQRHVLKADFGSLKSRNWFEWLTQRDLHNFLNCFRIKNIEEQWEFLYKSFLAFSIEIICFGRSADLVNTFKIS